MWKFLIRRLMLGILIVVMGAFVVYAVLRCLPASYVEKKAREYSASSNGRLQYEEVLQRLKEQYGLDKSVPVGFVKWLGDAVRGDFGDSWQYAGKVVDKFEDVIWWSVLMNIITLILQTVICIPLGILAARKQYSRTDYAIMVIALACISLPTFYLATLLKYVFAVQLGWFPLNGMQSRDFSQMTQFGKVLDIAYHFCLPVITLAMLSVGGLTRYTRTNMLEVLNADYIRTARAKGLPEKVVINRHAFRNTLIPLVSYMSYLLPSMFGGAMITEQLFEIEGIGRISFTAMVAGDIPFTMFYTTFIMVLTQVSLILADIMYAVVDPRVRVN
ncbi:MAG TPA: ABC transporter permease [Eubacteriales bacterium]|nr:ABC transporter permease [Clostridia bacterium]HRV73644.1 ABC transporter permease [Eubacteriales bacterium]